MPAAFVSHKQFPAPYSAGLLSEHLLPSTCTEEMDKIPAFVLKTFHSFFILT